MEKQEEGMGPGSAGQSGDTQGLSDVADAGSESVEELLEEGQAFEVEAIGGVENAADPDVAEVSALEGAALPGGLSAIGAGLFGMDIPKDSVVKYETDLRTDKFLLVVHDAAPHVEKARAIPESTPPIDLTLHAKDVTVAVAG